MIYKCPYCKFEKETKKRYVMVLCPTCQCSMIPENEIMSYSKVGVEEC